LNAEGGEAVAVATDVTHHDQVKNLVDAVVQKFGRIDVMINNAGLMPHSPLERLKIDDWNRTIDVNIKGVLFPRRLTLVTMVSVGLPAWQMPRVA
jgi:NADP-dependent 3-hydroxy acid dehydrogenase YdfG